MNRCFSQCYFLRLQCLRRHLRPVSNIQMRKKRCTMGKAVGELPGWSPWSLMLLQSSWPLMLLLELKFKLNESLLLVASALSIASFWVKSQPKLKGNSSKILYYCDRLALHDGHYAYQWDQHRCCYLKLFWSWEIKKTWQNEKTRMMTKEEKILNETIDKRAHQLKN